MAIESAKITNIFLLFIVFLITNRRTCLMSTAVTFHASYPTWFWFCIVKQVIVGNACWVIIIFLERFWALVCCHSTVSSEYFSLLIFLFIFFFVALLWRGQCPFISIMTYEDDCFPLINGLYSCLFTMYIGHATLFLPLGLGEDPHSFWWNRKCKEHNIWNKPKDGNGSVRFLFSAIHNFLEIPQPMWLSFLVKMSHFGKLLWWGLSVVSAGWCVHSGNTLVPSGKIPVFHGPITALPVDAAFMNAAP